MTYRANTGIILVDVIIKAGIVPEDKFEDDMNYLKGTFAIEDMTIPDRVIANLKKRMRVRLPLRNCSKTQ